jgi:hypothetical protein
LNVINQSIIGAKEGVVEAVSKLVGSDITEAILRTADGSDFKSIDDYTLYCGTSDSPTSTNLSINGGDYLPWPVLVTLSR